MSPLVTRPSLPEPGTVAASTPLSAESFLTEGARGGSRGRRCSSCFRGRGGRFGGAGRAVIDQAEQRTDRDRVAIFCRDLAECAGRGRRNLDGDLVGLELH